MKMEPPVQEEPLSSTVGGSNGSANGTGAPPLTYETDRDKEIDHIGEYVEFSARQTGQSWFSDYTGRYILNILTIFLSL